MNKNIIALAVTLYIGGLAMVVFSADKLIFHSGSLWNIALIILGFAIAIFGRILFEHED